MSKERFGDLLIKRIDGLDGRPIILRSALAKAIGVSPSAVSKYCNHESKPDLTNFLEIVRHLEIEGDELQQWTRLAGHWKNWDVVKARVQKSQETKDSADSLTALIPDTETGYFHEQPASVPDTSDALEQDAKGQDLPAVEREQQIKASILAANQVEVVLEMLQQIQQMKHCMKLMTQHSPYNHGKILELINQDAKVFLRYVISPYDEAVAILIKISNLSRTNNFLLRDYEQLNNDLRHINEKFDAMNYPMRHMRAGGVYERMVGRAIRFLPLRIFGAKVDYKAYELESVCDALSDLTLLAKENIENLEEMDKQLSAMLHTHSH